MRAALITIWFSIFFLFGFFAFAGPVTTIDEFSNNHDCDKQGKHCTATLYITCANSKQIEIRVEIESLEKTNVDKLYDIILKECK